jgi:aminoglycoside 2'-N-acetyltransferase I
MREADPIIRGRYQLGALSDGSAVPGFYERLGWERWRGPTFVDATPELVRTEDDDGVMVLRTPTTGDLDLAAPLVCDWRPGDAW